MKKTKKKEAQKSGTKIFKIDAQGDTVYVRASTKEFAYLQLTEKMGPIPIALLEFSEVQKLPNGEELL